MRHWALLPAAIAVAIFTYMVVRIGTGSLETGF